MTKDGDFKPDFSDIVVKKSLVTQGGETKWPDPTPLPAQDASGKNKAQTKPEPTLAVKNQASFRATLKSALGWGAGLTAYIGMGMMLPDPTFLTMLTTFSLALVAGY